MHYAAPLLLLILLAAPVPAQENLIRNGAFERQLSGWSKFWSRSGGGTAKLVTNGAKEGSQALHISYSGQQDWSFPQASSLDVQPGDIFELTGWIRITGDGSTSLSVILYDRQRNSIEWDFGGRPLSNVDRWQHVVRRFVIPQRGASILPRLMGSGPVEVWLDQVSLVKTGTLDELRARQLPQILTAESPTLRVSFRPSDATISVLDKRSGRQYAQYPGSALAVLDAHKTDGRITFRLLKPDDVLTINVTIAVEADRPEFAVELAADGPMHQPLQFPLPFKTAGGHFLILPVNEGISYPVDDTSLPAMSYHLFGGHGLCMAFYGCTDLQHGLMTIVETPDDARVVVPRRDDKLCLAPRWDDQKQQFGATRRIRYCLFQQGGYVAMCKRYRQYAQRIGKFKTLTEKRAENPDVDRLVGAVNVWCWDRSGPDMCGELQESGIRRILWSRRSDPEAIRQMNQMGVLTSRYDIYQDVQNPANFSKIGHVHADWPTEAWPDDLIRQQNGELTNGWRVRGRDGNWYPCGVLCDRVAVSYAKQRVPPELETHDYRCRFIDTTTAASWRECYDERHPMTRSESRQFRMELLSYMSREMGLVTGSETGHDAAVPYVHYFEGMLSLGPYRVPDAGRAMMQVVTDVPPRVAKFQTGHYYRLPLWELVYHDCVVAQWYWGDYNNKLPSLWNRRDLWNRLYGTPPMFMFNRQIWRQNRDRFVQSYQAATPVARATGYHEMLSHRWLTDDHSVQQTTFANGVMVTVNFGEQPYDMPDGTTVPPNASAVRGLDDGG
jgi:hypothetical protein